MQSVRVSPKDFVRRSSLGLGHRNLGCNKAVGTLSQCREQFKLARLYTLWYLLIVFVTQLEQIVEEYLTHEGYFCPSQYKYRPADFKATSSDIDHS